MAPYCTNVYILCHQGYVARVSYAEGEEAEEQRPIIQKTTTTSHPKLLNLELPPSDPSSKIIQDFVIYDPAQFY